MESGWRIRCGIAEIPASATGSRFSNGNDGEFIFTSSEMCRAGNSRGAAKDSRQLSGALVFARSRGVYSRPVLKRSPECWAGVVARRKPCADLFFSAGRACVTQRRSIKRVGCLVAIFLFLTERTRSTNRNTHVPYATLVSIPGVSQFIVGFFRSSETVTGYF